MRSLSFLSANILLAWYLQELWALWKRDPPHLSLGGADGWGGGAMPGRTEEAPHDGWRQVCSHLRVSAVLICFFLLGDTLNFSKIKAQVESFPWNLRTVSFFFLESWFLFFFSDGIKETKQTLGSKVLKICPLSLVHAE